MKNFKKFSRADLKHVKGGNEESVGTGSYACCIGLKCSSTVEVEYFDDLVCAEGTKLVKIN